MRVSLRRTRRNTRYFLLLVVATWVVLLLIYYVALPAVSNAAAGGVVEVRDPEELVSYLVMKNETLLLFLSQKKCPACEIVRPAFEKLSTEVTEVNFIDVRIDAMIQSNPDEALLILRELGILGTPTFILVKDGVELTRHLGTFRGDQYEGLKKFIEMSLGTRVASLEAGTSASPSIDAELMNQLSAQSISLSAALGLIGAFSPCSLPLMLAVATSSAKESRMARSRRSILAQVLSIAGFTAVAGLLLSALYVSSGYVSVDLYTPVILLAVAFVLSWGIMNIAGSEPVLHLSGNLRSLLPVLGLQCSLPFLVAALARAGTSPVLAVVSALAFTAGYSAPFIASLLGGGLMSLKVSRYLSGRRGMLVQGIILVAVGTYLAIDTLA